jgi:anti-sigma regulatory factor (Ser/Thr protein kinase)
MSEQKPSEQKPSDQKPPERRSSEGKPPRGLFDLVGINPVEGLERIGRVGKEMGEPARKIADQLIQRSLAPNANLLEETLRSAQAMGQIAGQLAPKEVTDALGQLGSLADQVRREAVDPARSLADLIGDCLDGLDVLVATSAFPLPFELDEARLALARLRRPVLKVDLALPTETSTPGMAGRLVRGLVEGSDDLREEARDLDILERAIAEAVRGAVERTRRFDPRKPIEVRARLQADLLTVEVVDQGPGDAAATTRQSPPGWDVKVVRRAMDEVSYESAAQGGTLHLKRRLSSWRVRRAVR